jgi:hypothetical protein
MADIIQIRRDTAANWTSANPILAQGELGVETDSDKFKVGDGSTAWAGVAYLLTGYTQEVAALTGTTPVIAVGNGTILTWTLSGNSTPTSSLTSGQSVLLMVDDGSASTITWPSVTWKTTASAPTLNTSGYTAITLWNVSGTLYGARVGDS